MMTTSDNPNNMHLCQLYQFHPDEAPVIRFSLIIEPDYLFIWMQGTL